MSNNVENANYDAADDVADTTAENVDIAEVKDLDDD